MAQTFYPITPTEIVAGATKEWTPMDASGSIPADATGVILHVVCTYGSDRYVGLRKNGSTDDRHYDFGEESHTWAMIGVDASRIFEAWVESTSSIDIYVVGYTMAGVTFATNATDKSLDDTGAWTDIDCSTPAPNAIGLIFEVYAHVNEFGFRKNGSSDDRTFYANQHSCFSAIIGCDAGQICEGYIELINQDCWLTGYITEGATFNTNATDLSLGNTDEWLDLTALPDASPLMGIIEVTGAWQLSYGLRKDDTAEDIYQHTYKHHWGVVECDASRVIEGKISDLDVDFFLVGYATAVTITEKTSSDTGSGVDVKISGNPLATLSKSDTGNGADTKNDYPSALHERPDVGSGMEALVALLAILTGSETGAGVDVVTELAQPTLKTGSDSGSGVESLLTRLLTASEAVTGSESLLARLLHHTDSGLGSDASLTLLAALARAETGSGLDTFIGLISALATTEAGSGIDELLNRKIALPDIGSGLDIATLYKAFFSSDNGAGLDVLASLLVLTIASEVGSGSERLGAKIMTSPAASDMKLPTRKGKAGIPSKRVNL
ncbi:MAG: hypothetical protein IMY77_00285 [Chloroflexi bacterium]|nr:hypothetical protein [Chloroflexota bacterium]